jgi:hypothetical protein
MSKTLKQLINKEVTQFKGQTFSTNDQVNEYFAESLFRIAQAYVEQVVKVDENTSDGYHTFKELYEFRKIYNACLFNEWTRQGKYLVCKSKKHSDGEDCFGGGWFIVSATLPDGNISNHYEMKDWDLFKCREVEKAPEWDGHTAQDILIRLTNLF